MSDPDTPSHAPLTTGGVSPFDVPSFREVVPDGAATAGGSPDVPGYEVLGELGRGGMGVVYLARQAGLNRRVALKVLTGGGQGLNRFLAEAEAVAAVRHPHVVQVFDSGGRGDRPYLVLEYLPGGTLAARLAGGRLPPPAAAALILKVARGVAAAHDLGIVHRDLKPANVLFDEAGEPKVADFGLAKQPGGAELTRTDALMGTPAYMSPEQAGGRAKFVGPQADVWALGVILYECLTGTRPFRGDAAVSLLGAIRTDDPVPVGRAVPGVPRDLDLICGKCLEKDPADRYASANELAADLGRFVAGESIGLRPPSAGERFVKWARRKPALAAAYGLSLTALLLAGLVAGAVWLWREAEAGWSEALTAKARSEEEQRKAEGARELADQARATAVAAREGEVGARRELDVAKEKLARLEYARTVDLAHREWKENNIARARALLDSCRPDLLGWEWDYVHRLCHGSLLTIQAHPGITLVTVFSPDGTRILTAGPLEPTAVMWGARAWDARTGTQLFELQPPALREVRFSEAVFSPDGSRILTRETYDIARVWDARTGKEVFSAKCSMPLGPGSFSPDGLRVLTADFSAPNKPEVTVRVRDARTGKELASLDGHTARVQRARFSPDGSRVITAGWDGTARVWDARTGTQLVGFRGVGHGIVSRSPDGSLVLTSSPSVPGDSAGVWDAETGRLLFSLHSPGGVTRPSFSPDGSRVLAACGDAARVWDAKTGKELITFKGHTERVKLAEWGPDGSQVVTTSEVGTVMVWDGRDRVEYRDREVVGGVVGVWPPPPVLSPDGTRRLTVDNAGTAHVSDADTGKALFALRHPGSGDDTQVTSAAFSPDSAFVVTVGRDRTVRVWNARTGGPLSVLAGHTAQVNAAAFSPDGSRVVTTSGDRTVRVWDAKTGKEQLTLVGHTNDVYAAVFTPDGSRVVTGSHDQTARVWDAQTGTEILSLQHPGAVISVTFAAGGSRLVAGSGSWIRVWDAAPVNRTLTHLAPPPRVR